MNTEVGTEMKMSNLNLMTKNTFRPVNLMSQLVSFTNNNKTTEKVNKERAYFFFPSLGALNLK